MSKQSCLDEVKRRIEEIKKERKDLESTFGEWMCQMYEAVKDVRVGSHGYILTNYHGHQVLAKVFFFQNGQHREPSGDFMFMFNLHSDGTHSISVPCAIEGLGPNNRIYTVEDLPHLTERICQWAAGEK